MRIGELSERTGVSVRMLRYYEEEGLLCPARRGSGYRDYGAGDERVVRAIRQLGEAGLKLDFIRRFLPCLRSEGPILHPCPDLMAAMAAQMEALDAQIARVRSARSLLGGYYTEMRGQAGQESGQSAPPR